MTILLYSIYILINLGSCNQSDSLLSAFQLYPKQHFLNKNDHQNDLDHLQLSCVIDGGENLKKQPVPKNPGITL